MERAEIQRYKAMISDEDVDLSLREHIEMKKWIRQDPRIPREQRMPRPKVTHVPPHSEGDPADSVEDTVNRAMALIERTKERIIVTGVPQELIELHEEENRYWEELLNRQI